MGTAFDTAQADVEAQRRAANAAIAAGGSAGAAAFKEGQQQIDAARTAALNSALSDAAQRGQGDIGGLLSGIVGRPYQQLGAGLQSSAASHAADAALMGSRADNYFRQVGAAIPVSAQALERSIAAAKAKAVAKMSDSELRTRLMGAGELAYNDTLSGANAGHRAAQQKVDLNKQALGDVSSKLNDINAQLKAWQNNKPLPSGVTASDLVKQRNLYQSQRQELELKLAGARQERDPFTQMVNELRGPGTKDQAVAALARKAGLDQGYGAERVTGLIQEPKLSSRAISRGSEPLTLAKAAGSLNIGVKKVQRATSVLDPNQNVPYFQVGQASLDKSLAAGQSFDRAWSKIESYVPAANRTIKALLWEMYNPAFKQRDSYGFR